MASVGDDLQLAEHRLNGDLRTGRLEAEAVQLSRDRETRTPLKRSKWRQWIVRLRHDYTPSGFGTIVARVFDKDKKPVSGVFFVRRADLDKHYGTTPTTTAVDDVQPTPQRRKPGQKITKGWRLFAAHAAYEFKEKHGRLPSGPELAQICEDKLDYQPDTSEIAKLFRYLLGD
jgi:hypothetical protein